jgi:hypothetical protein
MVDEAEWMPSDDEVLATEPAWFWTGSTVFVYAAWVDERSWVLRLNDFPEHPLYTLFIDGIVVGDLDDPPEGWRLRPASALPVLDPERCAELVQSLSDLGPYGAEEGVPCAGEWCTCGLLTEAYITSTAPAVPAESGD